MYGQFSSMVILCELDTLFSFRIYFSEQLNFKESINPFFFLAIAGQCFGMSKWSINKAQIQPGYGISWSKQEVCEMYTLLNIGHIFLVLYNLLCFLKHFFLEYCSKRTLYQRIRSYFEGNYLLQWTLLMSS